MKEKSYKNTATYIRRKCWRKYEVKRMRLLRKAARLLGDLSYPNYMYTAVKLGNKKIDNLPAGTIKMLFIIHAINIDDMLYWIHEHK